VALFADVAAINCLNFDVSTLQHSVLTC